MPDGIDDILSQPLQKPSPIDDVLAQPLRKPMPIDDVLAQPLSRAQNITNYNPQEDVAEPEKPKGILGTIFDYAVTRPFEAPGRFMKSLASQTFDTAQSIEADPANKEKYQGFPNLWTAYKAAMLPMVGVEPAKPAPTFNALKRQLATINTGDPEAYTASTRPGYWKLGNNESDVEKVRRAMAERSAEALNARIDAGQQVEIGPGGAPLLQRAADGVHYEVSPSRQGPVVDVPELLRHTADLGVDVAGEALINPSSYLLPGETALGRSANAARQATALKVLRGETGAARAGEMMAEVNPALRTIDAAGQAELAPNFTTPSLATRMKAGEVGVGVVGTGGRIDLARLPGAKQVWQGIASGMDWSKDTWLGKFLTKEREIPAWINFKEPSLRDVPGMIRFQGENKAAQVAREQTFKELVPIKQNFDKYNFSPEQRAATVSLSEVADIDHPDLQLRIHDPELAAKVSDEFGVLTQNKLPPGLDERLQKLVADGKLDPEAYGQAVDEARIHFDAQTRPAIEEFSKMTPDMRAAAFENANRLRQIGPNVKQAVLEATQGRVALPQLGGSIRQKPYETLNRLDEINKRLDELDQFGGPAPKAPTPTLPPDAGEWTPPLREIQPRVEGQPTYGHVQRVLETKLAGAKQWKDGPTLLAQLKKYVPPEELADTGIEQALVGRKTPITRVQFEELAPNMGLEVKILADDPAFPAGGSNDPYHRGPRYSNMRLGDAGLDPRFESAHTSASNYRELLFKQPGVGYAHPHWPGEQDVIAHARVQDRALPTGKALEIQEMQSDIHQAGKKHGYTTDQAAVAQELKQYNVNEPPPSWTVAPGDITLNVLKDHGVPADLQARWYDAFGRNKVPEAAFKESWPRMAMKHVLEDAAKGEYKYVTWPGEAAQVAKIEGWPTERAAVEAAVREGRAILAAEEARHASFTHDPQAGIFRGANSSNVERARTALQHAEDNLRGYDKYDAIANWYTKELPNNIRKYVEPAGGKLSQIDTPNGKMWAVEMTPELKQRILHEGQPLYGNMPRKMTWKLPTAEEVAGARNLKEWSAPTANEIPDSNAAALRTERDDLLKDLPQQLKDMNAVPGYFPGRPSEAAQHEFLSKAPALDRAAGPGDVTTAKRGFVHGDDMGDATLRKVPMTTQEISAHIARGSGGTAATAGRALMPGETLWDKFMTKTGIRAAQEELGQVPYFMKTDPIEVWADYFGKDVYRAVNNDAQEQMYRNGFRHVDDKAWQATLTAARKAEIAKQPIGLDELNKVFEEAGGHGGVERNIRPDVLAKVEAGEMDLPSALKAGQPPDGMAKITLNGKPTWIHEGLARDLTAYQRLGNDISRAGWFMRSVAPAWMAANQMWRKANTYAGPQFIAYNLRNMLGDWVRMAQRDLIDGQTAFDFNKMMAGKPEDPTIVNGPVGKSAFHKFLETGDVRHFADEMVDLGAYGQQVYGSRMVRGDVAFTDAMNNGVTGGGELRDMMRGADKAWDKAAKPGVIKGTWTDAKRWMAAREDAQRVAGYWTRLRAGDSAMEAAFKIDEAMFNMRRISPAVDLLRKTGVSAFVWPFKNIPMQLQWAIEHPGAFAAMMDAQSKIENGDLAQSQYPLYMQGKFNYVVQTRRDPRTGHIIHKTMTSSGQLPSDDLKELGSSLRDNGGLSFFTQQVGPALQMFARAVEWAGETDDKKTLGELASRLAYTTGRPMQTWTKLGDLGQVDNEGQAPNIGQQLLNIGVNPMKTYDFDVTKRAAISGASAKKSLFAAEKKQHEADSLLQFAIDTQNELRGKAGEKQAMGDEYGFRQKSNAAASTALMVQQARAYRDRIRGDVQAARKRAEALLLTP